MGCSDSLTPIPPSRCIGIAFAWRYHTGCGDDRASQVPGGSSCSRATLFDPGRTGRDRPYAATDAAFRVRYRVGSCVECFRGSITRPNMLAVYASQRGLPHRHARLASGCRPTLPGGVGYPQDPGARFQRFITVASSLTSLPRLYLAHNEPISPAESLSAKRTQFAHKVLILH